MLRSFVSRFWLSFAVLAAFEDSPSPAIPIDFLKCGIRKRYDRERTVLSRCRRRRRTKLCISRLFFRRARACPTSPNVRRDPPATTCGSMPTPLSRTRRRKWLGRVFDFQLDVVRAGMAEGVHQGLAADPIYFSRITGRNGRARPSTTTRKSVSRRHRVPAESRANASSRSSELLRGAAANPARHSALRR